MVAASSGNDLESSPTTFIADCPYFTLTRVLQAYTPRPVTSLITTTITTMTKIR
jgi:hypothetical protein